MGDFNGSMKSKQIKDLDSSWKLKTQRDIGLWEITTYPYSLMPKKPRLTHHDLKPSQWDEAPNSTGAWFQWHDVTPWLMDGTSCRYCPKSSDIGRKRHEKSERQM